MIISQTPLRVSLLGGNTDFPKYFKKYGGAVLTTTIDKYIYCIVKKRFDKQIWINYSIKEKVNRISDIKHNLVREALRLVGVYEGIEITFLSDIPSEGSGLGSSSAVVVGLLNALHHYINDPVPLRTLAEEACRIEVDILKKPIGYQDQYAVAFGGFNLIEFKKDILITPIEPEEISDSLMLFYTGITRSADRILAQMRLNKKTLDQIKEEVYKKLDHITDPIILGDLLERYWYLKRSLNKAVTNKQIDTYYQTSLKIGAWGGKIVGAGGGGFLLLVVPHKDQSEFRKCFSLKELSFKLTKYGSRIIFANE